MTNNNYINNIIISNLNYLDPQVNPNIYNFLMNEYNSTHDILILDIKPTKFSEVLAYLNTLDVLFHAIDEDLTFFYNVLSDDDYNLIANYYNFLFDLLNPELD